MLSSGEKVMKKVIVVSVLMVLIFIGDINNK